MFYKKKLSPVVWVPGVVLFAVVIGWAGRADAGILNSDGDFDAQTVGQTVGDPWTHVGGTRTVTAEAQSPYTNVYADNGKGASFPVPNTGYIIDTFGDQTPATAPELFFNVDFRVTSGGGAQRLAISQEWGQHCAVQVYFSDTSLWVGWNQVDLVTNQLLPDTWYNIQLDLDLTTATYSGAISTLSTSIPITTKSFDGGWGGVINTIFSDAHGADNAAYELDNFALSTTPLLPVIPEPATWVLVLSGAGALALMTLRRRRRGRRSTSVA